MSSIPKETDKDVLRRIMSEPTFKDVAEAARRENARREREIIDALRNAASPKSEPSKAEAVNARERT